MADRRKSREQNDSLWGEVARMEAEVNDPEEMETSVYDMRKLAELGQLPPGFSPKGKKPHRPPRVAKLRSETDDEADDATDVFTPKKARQRELAQAPLASADDEPLHEEDESKEPTETKIFDRKSSSLVAPAPKAPAGRGEAPVEPAPKAPVARDPKVPVAPAPEAPVVVAPEEVSLEPLRESLPEPPTATPRPATGRPHGPRVYGTFAGLVIVGFAIGYLLVAVFRLG